MSSNTELDTLLVEGQLLGPQYSTSHLGSAARDMAFLLRLGPYDMYEYMHASYWILVGGSFVYWSDEAEYHLPQDLCTEAVDLYERIRNYRIAAR